MRIRLAFAAVFVLELFLAAALGLLSQPPLPINDKLAHFLVFFLLTGTFYFLIDTTRRRQNQLTMSTLYPLAFLSEVVQGILPNDRTFDLLDILANVLGTTAALAACNMYHKRANEKRRKSKGYALVRGEEAVEEEGGGIVADIEGQELGAVDVEAQSSSNGANGQAHHPPTAKTIEQEIDAWDEHADDDWEEGEPGPEVLTPVEPMAASEEEPSKSAIPESKPAQENGGAAG